MAIHQVLSLYRDTIALAPMTQPSLPPSAFPCLSSVRLAAQLLDLARLRSPDRFDPLEDREPLLELPPDLQMASSAEAARLSGRGERVAGDGVLWRVVIHVLLSNPTTTIDVRR